jgi:hypothetical protein
MNVVHPSLETPGVTGGLVCPTLDRFTPTRQTGLFAQTQAHHCPGQGHQAANIAPGRPGQMEQESLHERAKHLTAISHVASQIFEMKGSFTTG